MLHIKNATIHTPDHVIEHGSVLVDGPRIAAVGPAGGMPPAPGAAEIDATGLLLVPGFVELQLNGAFGHDFTADASTIWRVGEQITRYGVTAFLPTIITSPLEKVDAGRALVTGGVPAGYRGAIPLGLHAEGPFLNPKRKGAHNANYLCPPTLEAVAGWSPGTGVRLVTMAPELPGALDVIRELTSRGVVVSTGHSDATYDQALAGFDAGARYGTHLFNAQSSLGHRDPGLPGALLWDDRMTVGFIADGVHTHRSVIGLAWRMLGPRRMSLVSDAMAARLLQKQVRGQPNVQASRAALLSDRELEVFQLIGQWKTTRQIAQQLHLSIKTIEYYREQIKRKLGLKNAAELTQHATAWAQREVPK